MNHGLILCMGTKKFKITALRNEIKSKYGNLSGLKKHLKSISKEQYGCKYSEVNIYGCRIYYTSNENHFCRFGIAIPLVGMSSTKALGVSSLTKAGKLRCPNEFIKI